MSNYGTSLLSTAPVCSDLDCVCGPSVPCPKFAAKFKELQDLRSKKREEQELQDRLRLEENKRVQDEIFAGILTRLRIRVNDDLTSQASKYAEEEPKRQLEDSAACSQCLVEPCDCGVVEEQPGDISDIASITIETATVNQRIGELMLNDIFTSECAVDVVKPKVRVKNISCPQAVLDATIDVCASCPTSISRVFRRHLILLEHREKLLFARLASVAIRRLPFVQRLYAYAVMKPNYCGDDLSDLFGLTNLKVHWEHPFDQLMPLRGTLRHRCLLVLLQNRIRLKVDLDFIFAT